MSAERRLGGYRERPPPPGLEGTVQVAWAHARPAPHGAPIPSPGHRVLPETGVSLCFRCRRDPDGTARDAGLLLMGPIASVRFYRPDPGDHLEAVRIRPELCRDLLRVAPEEHTDALTPLGDVAPGLLRRLLPALAATRASREALALLFREIGRLTEERPPSPEARLARAALDPLRAVHGGRVRVAALAAALGVSERHLRRLVRRVGGTTPKRFQRVERLNRLVAAADATARPPWSRLAAATGYFDQAHAIQEVGAFAGLTPARLHRERRAQDRLAP